MIKALGGRAGMLASAAVLITSILAVANSPNVTMAVSLVALTSAFTVLVIWVKRHIEAQDAKIAECEKDKGAALHEIVRLREDMHKRDIAIAMIYAESPPPKKGDRRRRRSPLAMLLGAQDSERAMTKAHQILRDERDKQ